MPHKTAAGYMATKDRSGSVMRTIVSFITVPSTPLFFHDHHVVMHSKRRISPTVCAHGLDRIAVLPRTQLPLCIFGVSVAGV